MKPVDAFVISELGPLAENNEDFAVADPLAGVFAVADGVGSRPAGEVASRIAASTFVEELKATAESDRNNEAALLKAVASAHNAVLDFGAQNPISAGLVTTLAGVVLARGNAWTAHVGDSRVFRLRSGSLQQLTADHTVVAELVASQQIDAEKAKRHRLRKMLSRGVGLDESITPDITPFDASPGDWILLATDGLTNVLDQSALEQVMLQSIGASAESMCRNIVEAALANRPDDNVTAIAIHVPERAS